MEVHPKEWKEAVPFLLFSIHESATESLGFSTFELICGHEVRGLLNLFKKHVKETTGPGDVLQYMSNVRS